MDLWDARIEEPREPLFNRYLESAMTWKGDKGLSLLPFSFPACGHSRQVTVLQPGTDGDHAKTRAGISKPHADLSLRAARFRRHRRPVRDWQRLLAAAPPVRRTRAGRRAVASDIERKRLFDVREFDRLPGEAYRPKATARTDQRLRDLAATPLDAGQSVVIDAVYLRPEDASR